MKEFIRYIRTLYPVSNKAAEALAGIMTEVKCKKHAILQPIGHTCRVIYFVKKGALRIFYEKDGKDITESLEFENAFVARAESLLSGEPSHKGIEAMEDSTLYAINAAKLVELYDQYLEIERLFKKIFLNAFVTMLKRIESIQFYPAETRYANFVKENPNVLKRVPLKYIASYLGITQVSLSRIRAKH